MTSKQRMAFIRAYVRTHHRPTRDEICAGVGLSKNWGRKLIGEMCTRGMLWCVGYPGAWHYEIPGKIAELQKG